MDKEMDKKQQELNNIFFQACKNGDLKNVTKLLENEINVNIKNNNDETALLIACKFGHIDIVKLLIDK
jgi:ankyrin repeat protein